MQQTLYTALMLRDYVMSDKPLVGISTCLLGEKVRYDGGSKLDPYLHDVMGTCVEFVAVCPEAESGMGVPREAMRLVNVEGDIRLMTQRTAKNMTTQMQTWMQQKLAAISSLPLCGYIFKARSPSCGLMSAPCYQQDGGEAKIVSGLFAKALTDRFPALPVADEEQLHNVQFRDNFIERVFSMHRKMCRMR